ncbi:uncharacterized protein LOC114298128 [Camellia sinensis]|uniref:uncharacterized protein LOC114298128 n=1 Tax=Camellia sinensis TaxID=4442 RepID=UPI001036B09D|nr:uncharacterized protein LOC114298128 [Camellia sinensis]XP_028098436.1 uncharacterized protein LOC114298128 [Camellia sinensis]XP_028098437.1 uncharacterized protein LOC114298128 [Camellia sinensis]
MIGEDGDRHHEPGDFTTFLHTRVMAPLTPGVARAVPEVVVALAAGAGDMLIGGASAVAPIPGLLLFPTEIMYMRPDGVINQIPLEPVEERDRKLVFALGVEQIPRAYGDKLLQTIDRLLIMLRRRQTFLVTHGIEMTAGGLAIDKMSVWKYTHNQIDLDVRPTMVCCLKITTLLKILEMVFSTRWSVKTGMDIVQLTTRMCFGARCMEMHLKSSQSGSQSSTVVEITKQVRMELRQELRDEIREELREEMRVELSTQIRVQITTNRYRKH